MLSTREQILDLGEALIRTRGYHGFSYKDISQNLNIKNAAVHYHFPTKENLGLAIIQRSIDLFEDKEEAWALLSKKEQLLDFINIYQKSKDKKWSCLMGALSSSSDSLPEAMQSKLGDLATYILDRLTLTLKQGLQIGEFNFPEEPRAKAQLIISSLLSSLLLDRVMKEDVFDSIKKSIVQSVISNN
ncbi:transcriptional regulator, TetR family [Reichenbachiella faecimaris]|uniref:Transcriptional regulator, TetR family n=1 Tax=Reichenbachiella faecimaris TaxID=692418 RepID=A0A1W2GE24_REIFA|nr:TetR/AcrR family transcriptional regulator [Reichenbachiella faecimaris]SMD34841.1 transcriptional regulator, TetR family [Reichenbachiella faecimaris]